jgi:hypothetical protein
MTDRDDFLRWVKTELYEAELALHNGDADPRRGDLVSQRASEHSRCVSQRHWTA